MLRLCFFGQVNKLDATLIRSLLASYHATVVRSVSNAVPKAVMLFMVKHCHTAVSNHPWLLVGLTHWLLLVPTSKLRDHS